MTEEARGIGAALRAAREEKGWTTQDVGSRLRLMSRQIEAIEAEEFSRLGQPVFARGFVRNYAKLLGLDADELLEQMSRFKAAPVQEVENVPFTPGGEFWKSPWVLGGIAAAVLLIAVPVGLYLWLNSDEEEPVAAAVEQAVPPPPPPAPAMELPVASPAPAQPLAPAPKAVPAPAPPTTPVPAPQVLAPTAPKPAVSLQPAAPVVPKPVSVQPSPAQPAVAPAPAVQPPFPFAMQQPTVRPVAPVQPAPASPPAAEKSSSVRMQFDQAAWVQVRDSTGRTVHSGLNPAGSTVEISGKAPFYLVVGNAANVRVSYKGKPVDLTPYIDVTVARLTINQ